MCFLYPRVSKVLLILSFLAFVVFALPDDALGERVNLVLTLLLTAVAFKFAIADVIPKVHVR